MEAELLELIRLLLREWDSLMVGGDERFEDLDKIMERLRVKGEEAQRLMEGYGY
jgi:hypothetical protein